ncbi:hypothetical protein [Fodinicola feengrottensis]|nr:hypothetical protein [Fodinicola feengrottensis]
MAEKVDDEFSEFVRQTSGRLLATGRSVRNDRTGQVPGFHALTGDGYDHLLLGYYKGPIAKFVFTYLGKNMDTYVQKWSQDPTFSFVWFKIPEKVDRVKFYNSLEKPTNATIAALDANGNQLPLGPDATLFAE